MGNLVEVAKTDDIKPGQGLLVEVEGKEVAVFNCDGSYYAIENECTHVGGPLCEGALEGDTVTCPWHEAKFSVKTGECLGPPAKDSVKSFKVHVEGDRIKIEI